MFQILEEEVHNEPGVALRRIRRVDSAVVTLFDLSSARLMVNEKTGANHKMMWITLRSDR
jgi:hypothetical protein